MLVSEEMRMSHSVDAPVIVIAVDNAALLDLGASLWSADTVRWSPDSSHVTLDLRRYPGDAPGIMVMFIRTRGWRTFRTWNTRN